MLSTSQSCAWYEFICFTGSRLWMTWTNLGHEFRVMDYMKYLGSREPKLLNAMNSFGLRIPWTILGHEPMALNAMNNSWLCITWKTLSYELKALFVMKSSRLWLIRKSLRHKLMDLDAINNSWLLMTWAILGHEFMTLDDMKNSGLWMISTTRDLMSLVLWMLWVAQGYESYE